jgi:CHAT domain-containing protein
MIHLATHGTFRSGHPNDSFILLGDGDRITLFDLDQWDCPMRRWWCSVPVRQR